MTTRIVASVEVAVELCNLYSPHLLAWLVSEEPEQRQRCFELYFFFQAEDGIRDLTVTGVQTCALPIWRGLERRQPAIAERRRLRGPRSDPNLRRVLQAECLAVVVVGEDFPVAAPADDGDRKSVV